MPTVPSFSMRAASSHPHWSVIQNSCPLWHRAQQLVMEKDHPQVDHHLQVFESSFLNRRWPYEDIRDAEWMSTPGRLKLLKSYLIPCLGLTVMDGRSSQQSWHSIRGIAHCRSKTSEVLDIRLLTNNSRLLQVFRYCLCLRL